MTHHDWNEDSFDWHSLGKACNFFLYLRSIGRVQISSTKEKYGTMRLEFLFWAGHYHEFMHSMIYPGRLFIKWPYLVRLIDMYVFTPIARYSGLCRLVTMYQRLVFNVLTIIAVKKWPHIRYEIMSELEFRDLLYDWTKKKVNYVSNWTDV